MRACFRGLHTYGFSHAKIEKPNFSSKILESLVYIGIILIFKADLTLQLWMK